MTRRLFACAVLTVSILAGTVAAPVSADPVPTTADRPSLAAHADGSGRDMSAGQRKGRYKLEGDRCVWEVNDSGPNQCTPQTPGRFKKEKDGCVWDARDSGPDQCTPPQGRWKTQGSRCVWDPKDSGPNQCNPRRPRQ